MMHFDDYARIGRTIKRLNPGRFDENTDEEVARVHIEAGQFLPDKYLNAKSIASDRVETILNFSDQPGFLEGMFQVGAERRRAEILAYRSSQAASLTKIQNTKIETLRLEYEAELLPEILAAEEFIRELQMQLQVDLIDDQRRQIVVTQKLRDSAAKEGLTLDIHQQDMAADRQLKRTISQKRQEKRIDYIDHALRERLKVTLAVKEYREKVAAMEKLALADENIRMVKLEILEGMFRRLRSLVTEEPDEELRGQLSQMWKNEVKRLQGELHGLEKTSEERRAKIFGKNDGGGTPPQSGEPSGPNMGADKQSTPGNQTRGFN